MRAAVASSRRFWRPSLSFASLVGSAAFFSTFLSASFATFVCAQTSSYGPPSDAANAPAAPAPNGPSGPAPSTDLSAPAAPGAPADPRSAPAPAPNANSGAPSNAPAPANAPEKTLATDELATLFQAPTAPDAAIDGEPLSLEKLLFGVSSPIERRRRLLAYWDLSEKYAEYNHRTQLAALADKCVARIVAKYGSVAALPAESRAAMAAAQSVAKQRREVARLEFLKSRLDFDAAFGSPAARRAAAAASTANGAAPKFAGGAVLYVPTTAPTTSKYNARFEEMSRTRRLSGEAARLDGALGLLFQALESRARQSNQTFSSLTTAFSAEPPDEKILFALLDRYASARAELLATAIRYNRAIVLYVAQTVPGRVGGDAFLATLNQLPDPARAAAAAARVPKTFADDASARAVAAGYVAPTNAENPVRATSFAETPRDAETPNAAAPTPGARFEKADVPDALAPAPLAENAAPNAPGAPAETPEPARELPPSSTAPETPPQPATPSQPATPAETPPDATSAFAPTETIIRGQEPDAPPADAPGSAAPSTPPVNPAPNASASPSASTTLTDGARRVLETTTALFAATPEAASAESLPEASTSLRDALSRVPTFPSARAAVVRAYWLLHANCARLNVERATLGAYSQAVEAFNAKLGELKKAGTEPDATFVATAGAYLAAVREAQARVAEARLLKRDAQLELARATARPLESGLPVPSTLPFCGPAYRLSTPRSTGATVVRESVLIPEKLKVVQDVGSKFGPAATLFSPEVPSVLDGDAFVSLATIEKKRESALLFVELVVSLNLSIGDYVANFPAGLVSADRFAEALVGPEK